MVTREKMLRSDGLNRAIDLGERSLVLDGGRGGSCRQLESLPVSNAILIGGRKGMQEWKLRTQQGPVKPA
ncbi:MAG: hypothetical protein EA402_08505 [Planctomycetota bacterium]|nr:MAG: hypothetical protein EA402_08505 [Planctomycetota bacterium]